MKALGKLRREPGLDIYDAPMPEIGPDDVLIKIKKTAICGTDLHIYKWDEWAQKTVPVPMTIGHEFVGVIADVGKNVRRFKVGDRVSGEGHLICDDCRNCRAGRRHYCRSTVGLGYHRTGCFAEYLSFPASNTIHVPKEISDDVASFLDPLGNAVHTALSFDLAGEDVLITGAGPVGLMAAAIARHVGARHVVITDINDTRLKLAAKLGATKTVNVTKESLDETMKMLGLNEGFSVSLEMSGSIHALRQMIAASSYGGKLALLGILPSGEGIDWTRVIFKSLFIKGIYGREMYETWHKMIAMLESGLNVNPLITHILPPEKFEEAFAAMENGTSGKVIFNWE
jgi:threonine 3-dehydrogenase